MIIKCAFLIDVLQKLFLFNIFIQHEMMKKYQWFLMSLKFRLFSIWSLFLGNEEKLFLFLQSDHFWISPSVLKAGSNGI